MLPPRPGSIITTGCDGELLGGGAAERNRECEPMETRAAWVPCAQEVEAGDSGRDMMIESKKCCENAYLHVQFLKDTEPPRFGLLTSRDIIYCTFRRKQLTNTARSLI